MGSTVRLNMNGWLTFDNITPPSVWNPVSIPNSAYTNSIMMNWTDLNPGAGGTSNYGTNGTAPNRVFIIEFVNVVPYSGSGSATFQLQLHEGTDEIRLLTTNFNPSSATGKTMGLTQSVSNAYVITGRNDQNYSITTAEGRSFIYSYGIEPNGRDDGYDSHPMTLLDMDGDGRPNYQDVDSDGDGITDCIEAGGLDTDGDGRYDVFVDVDFDGLADAVDGDVGNESIAENTINCLQLTLADLDSNGIPEGYPMGDYDGDGYLDFLDIDVDNDGILDNREVQEGNAVVNTTMQTPLGTDADGDGYDDRYDADQTDGLIVNSAANGTTIAESDDIDDFDGDGVPNHKDADSDNDGIVDFIEADSADIYTAWSTVDIDQDGLFDFWDADTTGVAGSLGYTPNDDADDTDGFPDYLDGNADGDALLDYMEAIDYTGDLQTRNDYMYLATNYVPQNGGVAATNFDNTLDSDFDGIPNWFDDDVADIFANFLDPNHTLYADADNDGLVDIFDADQNAGAPYTGVLIPGTVLPYPSDYDDAISPQSDWRDLTTMVHLPVEWLEFEVARIDATTADVLWSTASEKNNEKFLVQKSADDENYETIGEVLGNGTTSEINRYSFTDYDVHQGLNYYRLVQIDLDGKQEVSEVKVLENNGGAELVAYPNPSKGKVQLKDAGNYTDLRVFDMSVFDVTASVHVQSNTLNLAGLRKGVYIVQLGSAEDVRNARVSLVD